jgi:hypothetical protein
MGKSGRFGKNGKEKGTAVTSESLTTNEGDTQPIQLPAAVAPVLSTDAAAYERVLAACIDSKTQKNYASKMKYIFKTYLRHNVWKGEVYSSNDELHLKLPLNSEGVYYLFGQLAKDVTLPRMKKSERKAVNAVATELEQFVIRIAGDEDAEDADDDIEAPIEVVDEFVDNERTISKSCMQGYKSALKNYVEHIRKSQFIGEGEAGSNKVTLDAWCDNFINGYTRKVADKKTKGIMKVKEGKSEISFSGYIALNEQFIFFKPPAR